jgi:S1-C subfamily serine protease
MCLRALRSPLLARLRGLEAGSARWGWKGSTHPFMSSRTRDPKYIALLALVAGVILLVGNLVRPGRHVSDAGSVGPTQAERVRLQRMTQKATLEDTVAYFAQIAAEIAPRVVRIDPGGGSGIVWDAEGLIVTAGSAAPFPPVATVIAQNAGRVEADTISAPPGSPLVALRSRAPQGLRSARREPVIVPYAGEWVVMVWRSEDLRHAFVPALYLGRSTVECGERRIDEMMTNIPLTEAMFGGGLFDQEARLLAVVVRCGNRLAAMSVESIAKALQEGDTLERRLLARFGMGVVTLGEKEGKYFGAGKGVWVRDVWAHYPAEDASLEPGDIIVGLDGAEVESTADLNPLIMPVSRETFELRVLREGRARMLTMPARAAALSGIDEAGVLLAKPDRGVRIEVVADGGPAHEAGIRSGDRVLSIDGRSPASPAQVQAVLKGSADKPRFLVLERGGKTWGVLLDP